VLECVVNISEGRRRDLLEAIAAVAGDALLDLHSDADHNRSVLTLVGEEAPRAVTVEAVARLDLRDHEGAHPRFGVVDVVPFVPLSGLSIEAAVAARDAFARWAALTLDLPCFLYGPERTLPAVRSGAFGPVEPDVGPREAHPTAGAVAVGARPLLVAYNLWLRDSDLGAARDLARRLRSPHVRALALPLGGQVQVSLNLIAPDEFGPADAYDAVAAACAVARAELVGLIPASVLRSVPAHRWTELDLAADRTIEARLERGGWS
jgi:glutamate formiminotransferase / 5-formyltetrahydrofolate cyclo-ligase